jgi:antitoxin HicB
MQFIARLEDNGQGGFLVRFDDVPEALTEGKDEEEALANATDALEVALLGYMKDGKSLPEPSTHVRRGRYRVVVRAQAAAKLAFYSAFKETGLSRVALAKRLGKDEAEIRRMLDPHYATKLPALDDAMRALGKRLTVGVEAA